MTDNMTLTSEVILTASAAEEVLRLISANGIPSNQLLRVGVTGGGCSGLSYALSFDDKKESDVVVHTQGLDILVDKRHLMYLQGVVLDFQDGLNGRGFTFNNPNAKKTCGCGSSFSA